MFLAQIEAALIRHRFNLLWVGWAWVLVHTIVQTEARLSDGRAVRYTISDLMTNYQGGFTRRGLLGEGAVLLAQTFGGSPIYWAVALGALAYAILIVLVIRLFRRVPATRASLVLMLSPLALLFPVYDAGGAGYRKELFGFLGLALMLNAAIASHMHAMRAWVLAGVATILIALFAHEANVFLAPAYVLALLLLARVWPEARAFVWRVGVAAAGLGALCLWVVVMAPPADLGALCAASGLDPCEGAINALRWTTAEGVSYVVRRRDWFDVPGFLLILWLGVWPIFAFIDAPRRVKAIGIAAAFLGVLPLFILGFDWGRWCNMIVLPLTLLAAAAMATGQAQARDAWSRPWALIFIGTWSIHHANLLLLPVALVLWPALIGLELGRRGLAQLAAARRGV